MEIRYEDSCIANPATTAWTRGRLPVVHFGLLYASRMFKESQRQRWSSRVKVSFTVYCCIMCPRPGHISILQCSGTRIAAGMSTVMLLLHVIHRYYTRVLPSRLTIKLWIGDDELLVLSRLSMTVEACCYTQNNKSAIQTGNVYRASCNPLITHSTKNREWTF